ncbi:PREDICTED: phosphatidylinositol 4-kinase gamma 4-like [Camelina sativa]|uniref:1-phosphatidylinositol 4-kinase n=1 Tax=Camelina sativa TaxID=90675 RepID=A0ABM0VTI5_CAMSA|nr:PREDICTED: phosphatidylinositol 4-kinase gamma 4-like [Camelina sativa]
MYSGVLVEFRNDITGQIYQLIDTVWDMGLNMEEVHRIALADVRFGNMDRSGYNILVAIEENGPHLIPIDHGMCFIENGLGYTLCGPYWLKFSDKCRFNEALSEECINYVGSLNVDADIAFLSQCGWDFPEEYVEKFKINTTFLKKAVAQGFTLLHIGNMASFRCNDPMFTLQVIVESEKLDFMTRVENRIDERLKGYNE